MSIVAAIFPLATPQAPRHAAGHPVHGAAAELRGDWGLTGCGSGSGFFGQPQQSYTIKVLGTVTGSGGATLQRSWPVTLTVQ